MDLKDNKFEKAEKILEKGEVLVDEFKNYWYQNQDELGDFILQKNVYQSITTTLNNIGLIKKELNKLNEATKYLKQTLQIEKAVKYSIIEELKYSGEFEEI